MRWVSRGQGRVTPHLDDEWAEIVECFRLNRVYTQSPTEQGVCVSVGVTMDLSDLPVFVITEEVHAAVSMADLGLVFDRLEGELDAGIVKLPSSGDFVIARSFETIGYAPPTVFWLFQQQEDAIVSGRHLHLEARNVAYISWAQCLFAQDNDYIASDGLRFLGLTEHEQDAGLERWVRESDDSRSDVHPFVGFARAAFVWASMIAHAPTGDWAYADRGPHSERVAKRRNEEKLPPVTPVRLIKTIHLLQPPPRLITPQEPSPSSPKRQNQRKTKVWSVEQHQRRRPKSGGFATVPAHLRGPGRDTETPPPPWYLVRP